MIFYWFNSLLCLLLKKKILLTNFDKLSIIPNNEFLELHSQTPNVGYDRRNNKQNNNQKKKYLEDSINI